MKCPVPFKRLVPVPMRIEEGVTGMSNSTRTVMWANGTRISLRSPINMTATIVAVVRVEVRAVAGPGGANAPQDVNHPLVVTHR